MEDDGPLGCPCRGRHMALAWIYHAPPAGEAAHPELGGRRYRREVRTCRVCRHFTLDPGVAPGTMNGTALDPDELRERFVATQLVAGAEARARRVAGLVRECGGDGTSPRALDANPGTAALAATLARDGWRMTVLDPHPDHVAHAREGAGVTAVQGDLAGTEAPGPFDVVLLSGVLDRSPDPLSLLRRAVDRLAPGGVVVVEVPDGCAAAAIGPARPEFFIEHLHAFSPESLAMLVRRAGLSPVEVTRVREPDGALTLAAACLAG